MRSHLQEMDLIEENFEVSSEYLHKFLKKLKEEGNIRNIINNQIFQSLLMSDWQLFSKEEMSFSMKRTFFTQIK